jgi:hypothetical protein
MTSNITFDTTSDMTSNIIPDMTSNIKSNILYNQHILDSLKYFIDIIRTVRNELLNSTDKYILSDYPISLENLELIKKYRTDLRNYMNINKDNFFKL